ncbi:putative F-box domain-containing protein [Medicago truncatula]|uniref:Putative F-box domain-containing protein n=1 Tax=Medicago truncatula TaxID=3880 RepID=A0A396J316_MEDTR|nr:putative F-box domain-containing protein [Medicago truncatula]
MTAEETAESPISVVPEELLIEIFYRIDNTLQLRCVCKLWKSLVVDHEFAGKLLEIHGYSLSICKGDEEGGGGGGGGGDDDDDDEAEVADEEEDDDDDEDGEEEEDDDEEEEEEEEEEKKEKQLPMNELTQLDNLDEEEKEKQLMMMTVAKADQILVDVQFLKGKLETINNLSQMQILEDKTKCLKSFLKVYLKSTTSSSS